VSPSPDEPPASPTLRLRARRLRESAARTSRGFRLALLALAVLGGAGILAGWRETRRLEAEVGALRAAFQAAQAERRAFEARVEAERRRTADERAAFEARVEESRRRESELEARLAEARSGEVQSLRDDLATARARLVALEAERAAGERVIRDYGAGVCLIQGAYALYDAASREPQRRVDFFGTGFLVDRAGLLPTNRHVAEPWAADAAAAALVAQGRVPRFIVFRAFFPREPEPYELDLVSHSDAADLSLVRLEPRGRRLAVLPLEAAGRGAIAGQPVVVVGYPTGLEALLAKADAAVVREILETAGHSPERVTEAMARKGLIRPSTTQGHIGDVTATDVVFDAPTTQGGSGGPVFNKAGRVVAVEYAVLGRFGGNSFGVPVRFAHELLKAAGRRPAATIGAR
jgi:S1-C subfamily serine protease